jgi:LPS O-antigen subunit length determinant protein (WzzB/FepE family)
MIKKSQINKDEINLIDLMLTLWKGKWKIALAVAISLIAVITHQSTKTNSFTAISKIKPLSILELNKFLVFNKLIENINSTNTNTNTNNNTNSTNTNTISASKLLNLYLSVLNDSSVFEDGIRKFNLLEVSQYNNEQEYSEAIIRLASSVEIFLSTVSKKTKKENLEVPYYTISFTYHDAKKWKSVLMYVDKFANELVQKAIIDEYNNILQFLKNKQKYQLEDISIKINNRYIDYERETSDKLSYLKEQSAIAKQLGIAKNTIEVQTFGNKRELLSNVQTDSPFYLRGYEAIDKEIELIMSRNDKKAFISGLFALEKAKRAIEQNRSIERFELAFQSTNLQLNNEFSAASTNFNKIKFIYKDDIKMFVLAILIGLMAGIFYVLVSNEFQSFRVFKKN